VELVVLLVFYLKMREIKFRVWDDQIDKMVVLPTLESFRSGHLPSINGTPVDYQITSGILEKTVQENSKFTSYCNDMVMMQYTGMVDRDACYIYERDLLKTIDGIFEVFFDYGCFNVERYKVNGKNMIDLFQFINLYPETGVKIVGNTYENPDLVDASKKQK
jgi:hypothetical protein